LARGGVEAACDATERAAAAAQQAAGALARAAKSLEAAAAVGDTAKVRKAAAIVAELGPAAADAARHAVASWPFSSADEEAYLSDGYVAELRNAAAAEGIRIDEVDNRLSSFPLLIRLLPNQSALRIDAKRITTLRPSVVVARLREAQAAKPKLQPDRFIEVLFDAYLLVVEGRDNLSKGARLLDVYDALTLHPDMRRSYERAEFVRDVHLLDVSSVRATRSGYAISFPGSTAMKTASKVLSIIDQDGRTHTYYGIRFQEGGI
jgi:hypothetical protein